MSRSEVGHGAETYLCPVSIMDSRLKAQLGFAAVVAKCSTSSSLVRAKPSTVLRVVCLMHREAGDSVPPVVSTRPIFRRANACSAHYGPAQFVAISLWCSGCNPVLEWLYPNERGGTDDMNGHHVPVDYNARIAKESESPFPVGSIAVTISNRRRLQDRCRAYVIRA